MKSFSFCNFQQADSRQGSSRQGSSRKGTISKISSAGEQSESRTSRLVSSSGRPSTTQRSLSGCNSKSPYTRTSARGTRDDPVRNFELLSIGSKRRQ